MIDRRATNLIDTGHLSLLNTTPEADNFIRTQIDGAMLGSARRSKRLTERQKLHLDRLWMKGLKRHLQLNKRMREQGIIYYGFPERLPR